jgi:hypothetical protein
MPWDAERCPDFEDALKDIHAKHDRVLLVEDALGQNLREEGREKQFR